MPPTDNLDPLIMQNDERHETLKGVESLSEAQLMKQDEISEGIRDLNLTAEQLLMQGDEQKNQSFEIEANDQNSLALWNLLRGPKGNKGDKGDKGDTGENAVHNPEIAVEALRNDEAFQAAVKGEKGDQGEQGPAGFDGRDGMDGRDGLNGMDGAMGIQGIQGEQGPRGERGLRGLKGEPGRDGKGVDEKTVKDLKEGVDFAVKRASKTVSLVELDDVDLSQATISNGKYVIPSPGSGSGDVTGPASAVNNNIAVFDTTTGKLIKDGGATIASKQDADADLTAIAALSTTGIAVRTGAATWAVRDMTYPAAGLVITNSAGIADNPAFSLANDLAAVEGLATTGIVRRTGTDTWSAGTAVGLTTEVTGILPAANGGTGNGFTAFSGPTTATKTFTLPDASSTIVVQGGALGTPSSGTVTNLTGTASININGTVGATTPTTASVTTLTTSGNIELGNASDTTLSRAAAGDLAVEGVSVLTTSNTKTVSGKRQQPRTASSTTSSNLSPDLSTANVYFRTTQTATLTIDAPTGTPVIGETIMIYVDSAAAQTLTINATYKAFGAAFPATTTAGKTFMMSSQYNGTDWKTLWAVAQ
jgi:hypothetical protein